MAYSSVMSVHLRHERAVGSFSFFSHAFTEFNVHEGTFGWIKNAISCSALLIC